MTDLLDLDAYFDRIRCSIATEPTYATLAGLLDAHIAQIPFENFDVLLGRSVRLDLEGLQAEAVHARRGSYCFEHAARVIVLEPRSEVPRTHMFLSVTVDGTRYVVDPGFGPFASRLALMLDGGGFPADHPTHRMEREGDHWVLHAPRDRVEIPPWISSMEARPRTRSMSWWRTISSPPI